MEYLHIKNWSKFQHYKDRNPPWIKLHFELLSSRDWVMLDDASKLLAVACMLIASRDNGYIPHDEEYLKRVAYLSLANFKPLINCGFLSVASESEHLLATARPETETETETETDHKKAFSKKGGKYARQKSASGSEAIDKIIARWEEKSTLDA